MNAERFARLHALFERACGLDGDGREALVRAECAGDAELEGELRALLDADGVPRAAIDEGLSATDVQGALRRLVMEESSGTAIPARVGSYRVLREIASGGMGTVYEAEQDSPRRRVALKVMRAGVSSRQAQRRFEYESQVMARLRHPGIAQIFEAGWTQGEVEAGPPRPFFAMEFVEQAAPITEHANKAGLNTRARLELLAGVCDAVHHGHQKGVVHRDLKPQNVLVGEGGMAKVIDFGVARLIGAGEVGEASMRTDAGQVIGTLQYMSPEQVGGQAHDLDGRSDVYALGLMLFELLTGQPPYDVSGTTLAGAARMIAEVDPPRLSKVDRGLRGDLEVVVRKALEKERSARYQSAGELGADVRRVLAGEPVVARAPTLLYTLRRAAGRNKPATVGLVAALLALVAGAVVSVLWAVAASRAKDTAERQAYRLALNAAGAAVRDGLAGEAADDLANAPARLRGWEWEHLMSEVDRSTHVMKVPVRLSTDARLAVDGGAERVVVLAADWQSRRLAVADVRTGALLREVELPGVRRAELSADGLTVRWLSSEGDLVETETLTGAERWRRRVGRGVVSVMAAPDGDARGVLVARSEGRVRRFEPGSAVGFSRDVMDDNWATDIVSPDLSVLIELSGADRRVHRARGSGEDYEAVFMPNRANDTAVAFAPDSSRMVIVGRESAIEMFDTRTLLPTGFGKVEAKSAQLTAVDWSGDGELIAVGASTGAVRVFTSAGVLHTTLLGHRGVVTSVRFTGDGGRLVSTGYDGLARVWDLSPGGRTGTIARLPTKLAGLVVCPVRGGAREHAGEEIVTTGDDGLVRVIGRDERGAWGVLREHSIMLPGAAVCFVTALSATADRSRVLVAASYPAATAPPGVPFCLDMFETATLRPAGRFVARTAGERFGNAVIAPDGTRVVGTAPGDLPRPAPHGLYTMVFDGATLQLQRHERLGDDALAHAVGTEVEFIDEGRTMLVVGQSDEVLLMRLSERGWEQRRSIKTGTGPRQLTWWRARPGAATPRRAMLALTTEDGAIELYDGETWARRWRVGPVSAVTSAITISPDGSRVVTGGTDGTIRLFESATGMECVTIRGHEGFVRGLEFSSDGRALYSCSEDGTVRVWRAGEKERPAAP